MKLKERSKGVTEYVDPALLSETETLVVVTLMMHVLKALLKFDK
jgi:hypothetical protein